MDRVYGWGRRQSQVALAQRGIAGGSRNRLREGGRRGLTINPDERRALVSYLAGVKTKRRVTVVNRTGWHEIGGRLYFVLPDETFGPVGKETVILDANAVGPYEVQGSLREWRDGIGRMAAGHDLMILVISAGLAGVLLKLAKQEGGGMNLYAASSTGKTTLIQVGSSLWGRGSIAGGYVRGWSATANGLEAAAASSNDTLLVLDELGVLQVQAASAAIYGLANGGGKLRMARDTSLRETKTWRVVTLSTGEVPMEAKLSESGGRKPRAGEQVRMLDILADRGKGFGVFSSHGPERDAGKLADAFKLAAETNYGTAGPEFVRRVIKYGALKAGEITRKRANEFVAAQVPAGADGKVVRVARRLGHHAAAGELAVELKITPWKKGAAMRAHVWAFQQWLAKRGGIEPAEVRQAIEQVRLFIVQHGDSRFDPIESGSQETRPVHNRAGWKTGSGADREWLIPSETWKAEVCAGLDSKFVARTLGERNILKRASDGFQRVHKIDGKSMRVYVITPAIFDSGRPDGERGEAE